MLTPTVKSGGTHPPPFSLRFGVSPFCFIAVLVLSLFCFCRRFGVSPFWIQVNTAFWREIKWDLSPFWRVAVLVLSPFWRVAVLDLSRASSAMNSHALYLL